MRIKRLYRTFALLLTLGTSLVHAAVLPLESRLGGLAYYDANLDITWAANAVINGNDTWQNQVDWAATVDIGGVTGWRLPNADVDGNGIVDPCGLPANEAACADNEMGFMFRLRGIANTSPGPFTGVNLVNFWSGTTSASDPGLAWMLFFNIGSQQASAKTSNNFAWAVHSGDVAAVPIPAGVFLFGPALAVLGFMRRR